MGGLSQTLSSMLPAFQGTSWDSGKRSSYFEAPSLNSFSPRKGKLKERIDPALTARAGCSITFYVADGRPYCLVSRPPTEDGRFVRLQFLNAESFGPSIARLLSLRSLISVLSLTVRRTME